MKEFDICPSLITKSMTFSLWTHILDTPVDNLTNSLTEPNIMPFQDKDVGYVCTLSRFYALIIRIAIIGYSNLND